ALPHLTMSAWHSLGQFFAFATGANASPTPNAITPTAANSLLRIIESSLVASGTVPGSRALIAKNTRYCQGIVTRGYSRVHVGDSGLRVRQAAATLDSNGQDPAPMCQTADAPGTPAGGA